MRSLKLDERRVQTTGVVRKEPAQDVQECARFRAVDAFDIGRGLGQVRLDFGPTTLKDGQDPKPDRYVAQKKRVVGLLCQLAAKQRDLARTCHIACKARGTGQMAANLGGQRCVILT